MSKEGDKPVTGSQLSCVEAIGRTSLYALASAAITVSLINNGRQILKLPRGSWLLPTVCAVSVAGATAKWKMDGYLEILRQQKRDKALVNGQL